MYGLLSTAIRDYIITDFGAEAWADITPESVFDKMAPYPDEITYALIARASAVLEVPQDALLEGIGRHWVAYCDAQGYGLLFDSFGKSLRSFLLSLGTLHDRVAQSFPALKPPNFDTRELADGVIEILYSTHRPGLCPMVRGIIVGLGVRFRQEISIVQLTCARSGATCCAFRVELL